VTGLWIVVAVLIVLTALFLGLPLLRVGGPAARRAEYDLSVYKDQLTEIDRDVERGLMNAEQAEAARIEVQRRILASAPDAEQGEQPAKPERSWITAAVLCVAVPAAGLALYLHLGAPGEPDRPFATRPAPTHVAADRGMQMDAALKQLRAKLEKDPSHVDNWLLLARSYMMVQRFDDAVTAYDKVLELRPDLMSARGDRAEAMVMAAGGKITQPAREEFTALLAADRESVKARFYLAMAKDHEGDRRGAIQDLVDLLAISPPDAAWLPTVGQEVMRLAAEMKIDPKSLKPSEEALAIARARPKPEPRPQAPGGSGPSRADMEAAAEMSAEDRAEMIRGMVQQLADRLEANPDDREGWLRLANAYRVLGETAKAKDAQARADALK